MADPEFSVLHAVRLKKVATVESLVTALPHLGGDRVADIVSVLEDRNLLRYRDGRRVRGWMLTGDGKQTHAATLDDARTDDVVDALEPPYAGFLELNGPMKDLCTSWQQRDPGDDSARQEAIGAVDALHERAVPVFDAAAAVVSRFAVYRKRLDHAVTRLFGGDDDYFTSPMVDSYHTVWFECHEDFMLMLGIERTEEGSL